MQTSPEALLITGAYGTGKSLLAANLADELERRRIRFAAIDLDWLAWFDPGDEPADEERVFLANLRAVVANYRAIRIPWFVLAGSVEDRDQLEAISDAIGLPVRVLRLTAPIALIERRLAADGRPADHQVAVGQLERRLGESIAERSIENAGSIQDVVTAVLDWLGWE
jgi:hypothetical protein